MKTLYNIFFIACTACLTGALSSCNDWLDVQPDTETDKNALLSNEAGFADAMSGIYANMSSNELYGMNMTWYALSLMGGESVAPSGQNTNIAFFWFHPKNPETYTESSRNEFIDPIWNKAYNTIANVNTLLESIDKKKTVFAGNDYNVFKGELLGLRAFLHFDILRLFADSYTSADYSESKTYIPYVTELTSNVHPLLTNNQACELMLKDLEAAKELLKDDPMYTGAAPSEYVCSAVRGDASGRKEYHIEDWHNRRFHFNYYAAVATMARIYLWMGNKAKAKECALEVIAAQPDKFPWVSTDLVANIKGSTSSGTDRTFCTEQIFAMNVLDLSDRTDGYYWFGTKSANRDGSLVGYNPDIFEPSTRPYDIRYSYLNDKEKIWGKEITYTTKFVQDGTQSKSGAPWAQWRIPLIRISEMYYIAAECEDDLQKATAYLNTVRSHRGLEAYPLTINSRDELQEQIRREYHKEMIGEGQTFYYYKRLNKSLINKDVFGDDHEINPDLYTMPRPDDEDTYGGRTTANK